MMAVDSSSLVAYLQGEEGDDVVELDQALSSGISVIPPVVLTEIFSDPKLDDEVRALLLRLPILDIKEDFFVRASG
jgi:PIN domain nuclease of toxin-antitoxin system